MWQALEYFEGDSITEFVHNFQQQRTLSLSRKELWMRNNPQLDVFFRRLANVKKKLIQLFAKIAKILINSNENF
ncbi:MAG: hypothetical protein HC908_16090 [Calothrix sp. SM1_7_51]|nr:hypothetical protein [Calothrix sp. SM1_7_51]